MKTVWAKGLHTSKDKDARRAIVLQANEAFKVLTGILEEKIYSKETERNRPNAYELPGYPYFQADISGYIRAMKEVQSIIDLTRDGE